MPDAGGARQVSYLAENCRDFGIELLDILDAMPVGIVLTDGRTIEYININFSTSV